MIPAPAPTLAVTDGDPFAELESGVRSYCREFPVVFHKAKGSLLYSEGGKRYIDFFSGASALNYGHNNDFIKERLIAYLQSDGIAHGLDFYTAAKRSFLQDFHRHILEPRGWSYKVQFCGPTGANAVEAALKLARKVTRRPSVFSFMGGFHGMSLGSLSVTSHRYYRQAAGVPLGNVTFVPFPFGFLDSFDTIDYIEALLNDERSGVDKPAAIVFESVQAEGGVNIAPVAWLQRLRDLCTRHEIIMVCDDIQVGCGRTGPFFSFERAEIQPDVIVLSKSLSGYGLPLSVVLIKPEFDLWNPGEHNGTFRGNQLGFITASAALEYRELFQLEHQTRTHERMLRNFFEHEIKPLDSRIGIRGIGMIWGVDLLAFKNEKWVADIAKECFASGLIIERAGRQHTVFKFLPALNIEPGLLEEGCRIFQKVLLRNLTRI